MNERTKTAIEYIKELPEDKLEYAIKFLEALLGKSDAEGELCAQKDLPEEEGLTSADFEFVSAKEISERTGIVFDTI